MPITHYTGKTLLQQDTIGRIQKEAEGLLANKDVAGAYTAIQHIKQELSVLPKEEVAPALAAYRSITSPLKALALPVLSEEDVSHLLANNLEFLDTNSERLLVSGMTAWLAAQPDEAQAELKKKFQSQIDRDSPFAPKLSALLAPERAQAPAPPAGFVARDDGMFAQTEREELAASAQKARAINPQKSGEGEALSISRSLFSLSGSGGSEEAFTKRASALARSRLRDVRTAAEFADYAARPFAAGGLGLSGDALLQAERIVEEAHNRSHGVARHVIASEAKAERSNPNIALRRDNTISDNQRDDKIAAVASTLPRNDKDAPQKELDALIQKAAPVPVPTQASARRVVPGTKPRLDDVTPGQGPGRGTPAALPRTMGLSDELGTITLSDFRAFGDAGRAKQVVLGKIATLEGESIGEKVAGIRTLRASPLFASYLRLGDSALSSGKKLAVLLGDPAANPNQMTEDEFFTIADLARTLR
ncbi:MAG: hypothetical protein HYT31_02425 [Parcubacteria group bacterium]|nr:hypothetical protein [Parcubacteria group bacterium]